jgi:hypothetical protein
MTTTTHRPLRAALRTLLAVALLAGGLLTAASAASPAPAAATTPVLPPQGYWLAGADGGVFAFGSVGFLGSMGGTPLNRPIVGMAAHPLGDGYWLFASDGGVFAFGHANFFGSTGSVHLNSPVVAGASTPTGRGYWLFAADGGVFSYGDAQFYGSMGGLPLNKPVVGGASTPSGGGYWLVASDGGIFAFGDARFRGSLGGTPLNRPITAMAAHPNGQGYWLVASDGGVFNYGGAPYNGSLGGGSVTDAITAAGTSHGYVIATQSGRVAPFGPAPFLGSLTGQALASPIVAMAATSSYERPVPTLSAPHVLTIVLENHEYDQVIGSSSAPYINNLAKRYGLATASYASTHPSLPNYLHLVAGSAYGITNDCTTCSYEAPSLSDELNALAVPWAAYFEGISAPCPTASSTSAGYAKKHNPFVYDTHTALNPWDCNHVKPMPSNLASSLDAAGAPDYVWVTPNLCDDAHDCGIGTADSWLSSHLEPVFSTSWFAHGGVVLLTFDEGTTSAGCCSGQASGGHIVTIVASSSVAGGKTHAAAVDHDGVLGTVERLYGVPLLGGASCSCSGGVDDLAG